MTSSFERKYMGFKVLELLLPSLVAADVGVVFSPIVVNHLVSNCRHEGRRLYSASKHLVTTGILEFVSVEKYG